MSRPHAESGHGPERPPVAERLERKLAGRDDLEVSYFSPQDSAVPTLAATVTSKENGAEVCFEEVGAEHRAPSDQVVDFGLELIDEGVLGESDTAILKPDNRHPHEIVTSDTGRVVDYLFRKRAAVDVRPGRPSSIIRFAIPM